MFLEKASGDDFAESFVFLHRHVCVIRDANYVSVLSPLCCVEEAGLLDAGPAAPKRMRVVHSHENFHCTMVYA
jgi:hypothetical protein